MSVWLSPSLKPIAGGTYFPPTDSFGRPSFLRILKKIHDSWVNEGEALEENGSKVIELLKQAQQAAMQSSGDVLCIRDIIYSQSRRWAPEGWLQRPSNRSFDS